MSKDILSARSDFPILRQTVNDLPLVYLDNAATTQKPHSVIDAISKYYLTTNANIHRGNHTLAVQATQAYEAVRKKVAAYINAPSAEQIIFTRGTTESVNLVAYSFGDAFVEEGDEVIVSQLEHHSNYVPWELMCQRKGATFRVIPFDSNGELNLQVFQEMLNKKTRLVAINHVSNSLGTVNPVEEIIQLAHAADVPVLVDGAQSVQHIDHDVQAMDADFYAFSGHKIYAPMGVGVLYGKKEWLEKMPPFLSGGEMIDQVTPTKVTFNVLPYKFEAGTPSVADVIGLGAAIDYINQFDFTQLQAYEAELLNYGLGLLQSIPGLEVYANPKHRSAILPFNVEGIQHYDLGVLLDTKGIAVRTGQHCTQPIMDALHIPGTVRASLALYNTREDLDALAHGIERVIRMIRR
ncbi:MAG: cysteine desulfurase [Anaerolineaceae bacterium]|jgi:cysteine desulfurase/selenocysteine lyase|nr:cysteine desulfurase [Anaerolineaceae bacterium]MDD4043219.1 cysteine desulfurase [Anaerolineaceae bacterium]MDD4577537.1 cysteine desulfurase [Anaerolineaceae bacterium]